MDQFILHTEKLLINNDYVVVPGLGGFVVQQESAKILGNKIIPPRSVIGFNPMMNHTDGMLAITLSRTLKISYRAAAQLIENEVDTFKSRLKTSRQLAFGRLGSLTINEQGILFFEPATQLDILPANLGISELQIPVKQDVKPVKTYSIQQNSWIRYAAIAILFVGLFFSSVELNDPGKYQQADVLQSTLDIFNNQIVAEKENIEEAVKTIETIVTEPEKHYHVVIAGFNTISKAEQYCNEVKSAEYPDCHVQSGSKIKKVIISSFATRDEAQDYMENLRKSDKKFKDAWVLVN